MSRRKLVWEKLEWNGRYYKKLFDKILQEGNGFSRIGHDGTKWVEKKQEQKEI